MIPSTAPQPESVVHVAIVEDNTGLRESLTDLLNNTAGFRCVGAFDSAELALRKLPELAPEVVLMDIHLPGISGVECVRRLSDLLPGTRILMLTVFAEREHIFEALKAGAHGYLSKRTPPQELLRAILDVRAGGAPMSSEVAARVVAYFHQKESAPGPMAELSAREEEVLRLVARGFRSKEIAEALEIGVGTVNTHIRHIYEKLHVRSRAEAVARFVQNPR